MSVDGGLPAQGAAPSPAYASNPNFLVSWSSQLYDGDLDTIMICAVDLHDLTIPANVALESDVMEYLDFIGST